MIDAAAVDRLRARFQEDIGHVVSARDLQTVRDQYLGRKQGAVVAMMKAVATAPADQRPTLGRLVNDLKKHVESQLAARRSAIDAPAPATTVLDVTLPGRPAPVGHRHPLTVIRERIEAIFTRMGFQTIEGPEAEDDYHNFEALQMPAEHPARDMQDTLYLGRPIAVAVPSTPTAGRPPDVATLLRTHTSAMQIRYMETHQPPIRIIAPGRVYRRDNLDLTHTPMFTQVEGLLVDEGVSLADLKGSLVLFLRELFDEQTAVRFRPSFFPYTEPSAEVDISCVHCNGQGCPVCKRTGWLEILGSGLVHPAVLEGVGYDSERYTGWAFGMGIERVAMLKYRVDDIRLFYENDLRFLEQFSY